MKQPIPLTRDLVLIGGGHTHALVLRRWGMSPLPGVRVTVINPGPTAPYSGMLPGFVAGHYSRDELDIDLVRLARFAGARLIVGRVEGIDRAAGVIHVPGRPPIGYDVASIDIGITSAMPDLDGFTQHGIPAKPLGTFAARWDAFRKEATDPKVAVIGGGVAGTELAMAMAHALREAAPKITLIDRGAVLDGVSDRARTHLLDALDRSGVVLAEHVQIRRVCADGVDLSDGTRIDSDFTTGAAGARPQIWLAETGLSLSEGFVTVGPTLQSSDPAIFAVGDCAHMSHNPRPKAGVFAVRQAPVLFDNLRAYLSGRAFRSYRPQKDYLKLISLGDKSALAEKFGRAWVGPSLWRWKNQIDCKFMRQFRDLAPMESTVPPTVALGVKEALGSAPFCAGCGAKVGRGALQTSLSTLPASSRSDITQLPGDDAALLNTGGVQQVFTTDHLSAVTEDPVLMARIAAIHALGDIWSMGAAPQAGVLSVTLPRQSEALQARALSEVTSTVAEVLQEAGAALVGGHTTMGAGLTIGLSLTGLCDAAPITLVGAQPGDLLVLTKPIGSGTILAAEMRGVAQGADVLACYENMVRPQADAARALSCAHAMTDVTGFGLAGHLAGVCEASGVAAKVNLDAVPLMQGAEALAIQGVRSALYSDNRADPRVTAPDTAKASLMFDPQTCGGLLAAVAPQQVPALNEHVHVIGEITEGFGVVFS